MAIYFASDVHLGLRYMEQEPKLIEQRFVSWLRTVEHDCEELYLIGDIFDFWFEWERVVPKGFTRLFGQLASMSDRGVRIHIFAGNHDMWLSDYFSSELGATLHFEPISVELQGKSLFIAHGDNTGQRPFLGRTLNRIFRSRTARWMFQRFIHPDASMRFGKWWSSSSRHTRGSVSHTFAGEDEYLVQFARQSKPYNYFIFGHLHTPTIYPLSDESSVVILGEWIIEPTYARMEAGVVTLHQFL